MYRHATLRGKAIRLMVVKHAPREGMLRGCRVTASPLNPEWWFFFFLLLSSIELSDTQVYGPQIRALLGTASVVT